MADQEPGWELYRTFLEVLREGSLSGAARTLGLTQPTVGRHIDALEAALGSSLFVRTQRGFSPTEAAETLRPYAESLAATTAALLRVASEHGEGVRGSVRVTASDVMTASTACGSRLNVSKSMSAKTGTALASMTADAVEKNV